MSLSNFILRLIPSGVLRDKVMGIARHLASTGSGAVAAWLVAHGASQSQSQDITQAGVSLFLALVAFGFSLWDKSRRQAPAVPQTKEPSK
jgi:uncharacterized membrane protein YebE (DUF533 family)